MSWDFFRIQSDKNEIKYGDFLASFHLEWVVLPFNELSKIVVEILSYCLYISFFFSFLIIIIIITVIVVNVDSPAD